MFLFYFPVYLFAFPSSVKRWLNQLEMLLRIKILKNNKTVLNTSFITHLLINMYIILSLTAVQFCFYQMKLFQDVSYKLVFFYCSVVIVINAA